MYIYACLILVAYNSCDLMVLSLLKSFCGGCMSNVVIYLYILARHTHHTRICAHIYNIYICKGLFSCAGGIFSSCCKFCQKQCHSRCLWWFCWYFSFKIWNMNYVYYLVRLCDTSCQQIFGCSITVLSREARSLAEVAFFYPPIMSVSYYSFEHCFAVYSVSHLTFLFLWI